MKKLTLSLSVALLIVATVFFTPGIAMAAPLSWSQSGSSGFGYPENFSVDSMAVFNNRIYAGVRNIFYGCEVWSYGGTGDWARVDTGDGGFGNPYNLNARTMCVFNDRLYVGTYN